MIVYAESSAVVAWLFREPRGRLVEEILLTARYVFASDLTLIECERVTQRETALGRINESVAGTITSKLASAAANWDILHLQPAIITRARQQFPHEPIRTLDALHVAWALHARNIQKDVVMLSLDERVRRVGKALGLDLRPE